EPWSEHTQEFDQFNQLMDEVFLADNGEKILVSYDLAESETWSKQTTALDKDGNPEFTLEVGDDSEIDELVVDGQSINVGDIGGILGSQIGHILGGNSTVGQVAASTLISAIGHEIGLQISHGNIFDPPTDWLDNAANDALKDLDPSFTATLSTAAVGQLSS